MNKLEIRSFLTLVSTLVLLIAKSQDINSGLIAKYEFSGNTNDIIGSNHGINNGASLSTDRFNTSNSAYFFDGINDYIEIQDDELLDFEFNEDFSISLWVNISSNQNDMGGTNNDIIGKWNSLRSMPYPYAIRYWNSNANEERRNKIFNLRYDTETCNHNPLITGDCYISTDQWHHLVFLKNGNLLEYYQDNILLGSTTDNTSSTCNTKNNNRILIGKRILEGRHFTGLIDDIFFYDRSLNLDEIQLLYEENNWSRPIDEEPIIVSFDIPNQMGNSIINNQNKTIDLIVPCSTDISELIAIFNLSENGVEAFVNDVLQTSGSTSNNFSNSTIYTLRHHQKCLEIDWTINVDVKSFNKEDINNSIQVLEFNIPYQIGATGFDKNNFSINIKVPCNTELFNLKPSFSLPQGTKAFINEELQVSKQSINDFSNSLTYTISSSFTCTNQDWIVTVNLETFEDEFINESTLIIDYKVVDQIGLTNINNSLHEVNIYMPCNYNLSELVNSFTLSNGAIALVNDNEQKSGESLNDFRNTVTYSTGTTNGCFSMDWSIYISTATVDLQSFDLSDPASNIPNIVTPNGDNYNEKFEVGELFLGSELAIFNRHGIKVYNSKNYKNEFSGSFLASGQYYYIINSLCFDKPIKGYINILR